MGAQGSAVEPSTSDIGSERVIKAVVSKEPSTPDTALKNAIKADGLEQPATPVKTLKKPKKKPKAVTKASEAIKSTSALPDQEIGIHDSTTPVNAIVDATSILETEGVDTKTLEGADTTILVAADVAGLDKQRSAKVSKAGDTVQPREPAVQTLKKLNVMEDNQMTEARQRPEHLQLLRARFNAGAFRLGSNTGVK